MVTVALRARPHSAGSVRDAQPQGHLRGRGGPAAQDARLRQEDALGEVRVGGADGPPGVSGQRTGRQAQRGHVVVPGVRLEPRVRGRPSRAPGGRSLEGGRAGLRAAPRAASPASPRCAARAAQGRRAAAGASPSLLYKTKCASWGRGGGVSGAGKGREKLGRTSRSESDLPVEEAFLG